MIIMKNIIRNNFFAFLPILFLIVTGCGPFQSVSYYDADGIYNNSEDLERKVTEIKSGKYYQEYFKDFGYSTPQYNLRDNSPNLQMGFNNDIDFFNFDYWNNAYPFWSPYNRFYYNRLYSFNRFFWPRYSRFMTFGYQSLFFSHPFGSGYNFYAFNPFGINYGVGDPLWQTYGWGSPWRFGYPYALGTYSNIRGNNFVPYNRGNSYSSSTTRNNDINASSNQRSVNDETIYNRGLSNRNLNNEGSRRQISNGRINNSMNGDGPESRPGINRNNLNRSNNYNNQSQNRSSSRNIYSSPINNSFNRSNNYGSGRSMNQNRSFSGSRSSGGRSSAGRSSGGRSSRGNGNQK